MVNHWFQNPLVPVLHLKLLHDLIVCFQVIIVGCNVADIAGIPLNRLAEMTPAWNPQYTVFTLRSSSTPSSRKHTIFTVYLWYMLGKLYNIAFY